MGRGGPSRIVVNSGAEDAIVGPMPVSNSDREFMRRIGAYKAAAHAEMESRHRASTLAERLRQSWALYLATRSSVRIVDSRDDDPSAFYARARARGLYRP